MASNTGLHSEEARELRRLLKGADSIELKLTLPEHSYRSAAAALGVDPDQDQDGARVLVGRAAPELRSPSWIR
jgi:hypothetical protein